MKIQLKNLKKCKKSILNYIDYNIKIKVKYNNCSICLMMKKKNIANKSLYRIKIMLVKMKKFNFWNNKIIKMKLVCKKKNKCLINLKFKSKIIYKS